MLINRVYLFIQTHLFNTYHVPNNILDIFYTEVKKIDTFLPYKNVHHSYVQRDSQ